MEFEELLLVWESTTDTHQCQDKGSNCILGHPNRSMHWFPISSLKTEASEKHPRGSPRDPYPGQGQQAWKNLRQWGERGPGLFQIPTRLRERLPDPNTATHNATFLSVSWAERTHSQVISFGLTPGASYRWFWCEPDVLEVFQTCCTHTATFNTANSSILPEQLTHCTETVQSAWFCAIEVSMISRYTTGWGQHPSANLAKYRKLWLHKGFWEG